MKPTTFMSTAISTDPLKSVNPAKVEMPGLLPTYRYSLTVKLERLASSNVISSTVKSPVILTSP